ncbi:hypothetical protein [Spiroplasma endosymbiont of Polydrusus pterygomalis]|uniref:hypothetical protein n=1 Tax=Spiroplasma endosymbiont of Polydrusus pterygomalis TaxID=3139327 RepID=UPI003CCB0053
MNKEKNIFINDKVHDVPRDGNCLIWAIIVAYLEPVKTDNKKFKSRYIKLFDSDDNYEKIFNFSNFDFKNNKNLVSLFRTHICNYIEENLEKNRGENKAIFKSSLLDSDINKKNKELYPNNSEETQIKKTLEQMRKDANWCGSIEIEAICNILNCNIIRNNEKFEPDNQNTNDIIKLYYKNNHYQYYLTNNSVEINFSQSQNSINNQPITIINAISPLSINSENDDKNLELLKKDNIKLKYEIDDLKEQQYFANRRLDLEFNLLLKENEELISAKKYNKKLKYEIDDLKEQQYFANRRLDLEFNLLLKENEELNEKINSRDEVIQQYLNEQQNQFKKNQELNEKINSRDEVIQQYLNEQQNQLKKNQHSNTNKSDFTLKNLLESDNVWKDTKKMKKQLEEVNNENKELKKQIEEWKSIEHVVQEPRITDLENENEELKRKLHEKDKNMTSSPSFQHIESDLLNLQNLKSTANEYKPHSPKM